MGADQVSTCDRRRRAVAVPQLPMLCGQSTASALRRSRYCMRDKPPRFCPGRAVADTVLGNTCRPRAGPARWQMRAVGRCTPRKQTPRPSNLKSGNSGPPRQAARPLLGMPPSTRAAAPSKAAATTFSVPGSKMRRACYTARRRRRACMPSSTRGCAAVPTTGTAAAPGRPGWRRRPTRPAHGGIGRARLFAPAKQRLGHCTRRPRRQPARPHCPPDGKQRAKTGPIAGT